MQEFSSKNTLLNSCKESVIISRQGFGVLCATLVASGVAIAMYLPKPVSLGAWLTAALLFVFAFVGRYVARRKEE